MDNEIRNIQISDVKVREDIYPRIEHDISTVEKYATVVDKLPPIEVNQHLELIDGKHRLLAHRTADCDTIKAIITETSSDAELLKLAVIRNASHGRQLSAKDKKATAIKMYLGCVNKERAELKKVLPTLFSVHPETVSSWTRDIDRQTKAEQFEKIQNMWLACHTKQEISDALEITWNVVDSAVKKVLDFQRIQESKIYLSQFSEEEFQPPIYNVWAWSKKADGILHPGNSDPRIVENLLWLYTEPFDIFVDPFAGGGSTIDVCKKRLRRYYVSDLTPIISREHEIRQHDILSGTPSIPSWKDVKVVYLDPPYWKQAEGMYGDDLSNLANMDLEAFHDSMVSIIKQFARKLTECAKIALIIQPTAMYPNRDDAVFTDHVIEIAKRIDLRVCNRIQAPYSTQQHLPQNVEWAVQNRRDLVISRELIIWEV